MSGRIYTKQGDGGRTTLFGGPKVSKSDLRLEAYGTLDELNAVLGLAMASTNSLPSPIDVRPIQNYLFSIGSHLACGDESMRPHLPPLQPELTADLEKRIDDMQKQLPELKQFILPGGTPLAGQFHLARTVCRRAERVVVRLHDEVQVDGKILIYLNRLSDYLFVAARFANFLAKQTDVIWQKPAT